MYEEMGHASRKSSHQHCLSEPRHSLLFWRCYSDVAVVVNARALSCDIRAVAMHSSVCLCIFLWPRVQYRDPEIDDSIDEQNVTFSSTSYFSMTRSSWTALPPRPSGLHYTTSCASLYKLRRPEHNPSAIILAHRQQRKEKDLKGLRLANWSRLEEHTTCRCQQASTITMLRCYLAS